MTVGKPIHKKSSRPRTAAELVKKYDFSGSGDITDDEVGVAQNLLEIELREEKATAQKKMAWTAIISMLIFSMLLFTPVIPESRVKVLSELLGLFYLAQAGIVGAYMGFSTWMSKNNTNTDWSN
jgi:hypothetical protein